MSYSEEEVNDVCEKTSGRCFYCGMKLAFFNYGVVGNKAAWEVDHFIPLRSNGAHQPYNWVPACVDCNTQKSDMLPWEFDPDRFRQGDRNPENYL